MRVPIRKGGEYTNMPVDPYLTQNKYNELKQKLATLKSQQPFAITEVKRLAELGDFSENAAYQMAKGRLRGLNEQIDNLQKQINHAIIIKPPKATTTVQLGSKVTIKLNSQEKTYLILGSTEVDLKNNIISHNSPIGAGLMNKKAGERVKIQLADKEVECEITKIA